jgi:putative effector of murein hydrolase LrgA (UPF0299 family)
MLPNYVVWTSSILNAIVTAIFFLILCDHIARLYKSVEMKEFLLSERLPGSIIYVLCLFFFYIVARVVVTSWVAEMYGVQLN